MEVLSAHVNSDNIVIHQQSTDAEIIAAYEASKSLLSQYAAITYDDAKDTFVEDQGRKVLKDLLYGNENSMNEKLLQLIKEHMENS